MKVAISSVIFKDYKKFTKVYNSSFHWGRTKEEIETLHQEQASKNNWEIIEQEIKFLSKDEMENLYLYLEQNI